MERESLIETMATQMKSVTPKINKKKFKEQLDKRTDEELEVLEKRINNMYKVQSKLRMSGVTVDIRPSFKSKSGMIMKLYSVRGQDRWSPPTFDCGSIDNGDIIFDDMCIDESWSLFDLTQLNFDRQSAFNLSVMARDLPKGEHGQFYFSDDAYNKLLSSAYKIWKKMKNVKSNMVNLEDEDSILYVLEGLMESHDIIYKASDKSKQVTEDLSWAIEDVLARRLPESIFNIDGLSQIIDDWFIILKSKGKQATEKKTLLNNFTSVNRKNGFVSDESERFYGK